MVQSGIAYAAGQLLAVVAPRTVLVVDAPTDWSLAGPLWELALDDAPVDEILDVLIRRGIRTAPSFAIVRVENDAVRALVRGSVPVCFERVGEPVRLDATGATTWLEGLISSARRVLVGAVETNSTLPFLVSTGVVLVSGLALPCGPAEPADRGVILPGVTEPGDSDNGPGGGSSAGDPYFSRPAGNPVPAGSSAHNAGAGREPRVVDLTRSGGGRAPAKVYSGGPPAAESRDSWALASSRAGSDGSGRDQRAAGGELNGHVPSVLESAPAQLNDDDVPEPAVIPESNSGPAAEPASLFAEPVVDAGPALAVESDELAEPSPAAESEFRYDPIDFSRVSADDPGELQDLDAPEHSPYQAAAAEPSMSSANDFYAAPQGYSALDQAPQSVVAEQAEPAEVTTPDPFDDLLLDPADAERPPGPSPVDLPKLDPPPLAVPVASAFTGFGVPAQPRAFGGAPAGWPPPGWPPSPESFDDDAQHNAGSDQARSYQPTEIFAQDNQPAGRYVGEAEESVGDEHSEVEPAALNAEQADEAEEPGRAEAPSSPFLLPPHAEAQPPALGELPLRVRGRSLRPEHRPLNGNRLLGGPDADQASPASDFAQPAAPPASGSLLLPAFFRGARAARTPDGTESELDGPEALADADHEHDSSVASAASAWLPPPPSPASAPPAAWVPPVRRGFPDRSAFNGGPPAMPGVLRPATPGGGSPAADSSAHDGFGEEPTEVTPGPGQGGGPHGLASSPAPEALREPPRLLGVWCDAGHVTSPDHEECRVCGLAVPAQAPILVARPPLGVLIFDNGDQVMVDRPIVLGRDPKPVASPDPETPVLHPVPSATGQVSRTHAEVRAAGWDVVLTDLDAMNGTALTLPGASPIAIEPGVPTLITPGARVDLGGESGFVFEVEA